MNKKLLLLTLAFFFVMLYPIYSETTSRVITETDKKVFLHYLSWYKTPEVRGSWQHWNFCKHNPNCINQEGQRDIAAVHYPLIEPYDSYDEKVILFHLLLVKACNIDGMIIDWYGNGKTPPNAPSIDSATMKLFDLVDSLRIKYGMKFELAIMYDEQILDSLTKTEQSKKLKDDFQYILNKYSSRESYLKYDEKPVIFYFQKKHGGTEGIIHPDTLDSILNITSNPILIYKDPEPPYLSVFDGCYSWVQANWKEDGSDWGEVYLTWFYDHMNWRLKRYPNLKFNMGGVWAGFDDIGVGRGWSCSGHRWIDRQYGAVYDKTWNIIFDYNSNPVYNFPVKWIQIITWNDWNEGTEIEPSLEYGYQYIQATKNLVQKFKNNTSPDTSLNILIPQHIFQAMRAIEKNLVRRDLAQKLINNSIIEYLNNNFKESISFADKAAGITAPKGRITEVGKDFFEIEWDNIPNATGYKVYYTQDSSTFSIFSKVKPSIITISNCARLRIKNLLNPDSYYVAVTSFNSSLGLVTNESWYENTIDTAKILYTPVMNNLLRFPYPDEFIIFQNYPNPFNSQTIINYEIPKSCIVELSIYNIVGHKILTLENAHKVHGKYSISWDGYQKNGDQTPSGVYFLYFKAGTYIETKKIMLIR